MDTFYTNRYPMLSTERDQVSMLFSSRDPEALMSCELTPDEARLVGLQLIELASKAEDWSEPGEDE